MLRQVAYDTLSRRDRKTRHLAVAQHLRTTFAGDGEEVTDVIARHYLDALNAIPDDPDTGQICTLAITAFVRAAERAERTGSPARAAASYAIAAELATADDTGREPSAGTLWERAAGAATATADYADAVQYADRARAYHLERDQDRAAARAQAIAGRALNEWSRYAEAREQLTAAVEVLRTDPDTDTVRALQELATLETFAGSPDADRLTAEALYLGQALDVGTGQLCDLFNARAVRLLFTGSWPEAIAYLREVVRLATQTSDNFRLGRALLNLAAAQESTDLAAAAEAARTAVGHLRRTGVRDYLATAILNLASSLVDLGDWDAAEGELIQAMDSDGLTDIDYLTCQRGWLAALRGDVATAGTVLAGVQSLRASESPQDKTLLLLAEAFTAAAGDQRQDALRHARAVLAHADSLGISHGDTLWAWPLAARTAGELGAATVTRELLSQLDSYPPGHVAPLLRAERDLARARLAASDGDQAAAAAFAAAIILLREHGTPYHLAHALLDHAQYLRHHGDAGGAAVAIDDARDIGQRLRCQPLLNRAANLDPATPAASVSPRTPA
jgi:tetratricopeptide (TPR) repeat protein